MKVGTANDVVMYFPGEVNINNDFILEQDALIEISVNCNFIKCSWNAVEQ